MAQWQLDPTHSSADFAARHMMISTVRGGFRNVTGTIDFDPENPEAASVEASIEVASMTSTGVADRDNHLKSPDFLDAEKYPMITFKSTRVEKTGDKTAKVYGDLTIRDVTRPAVIDAELLEGCTVQAHELDEMDEDQAACVAAHCFSVLFDHKVQQIDGAAADAAAGVWSGSVDGFAFTIRRDDLGDLVLDFSVAG